MIFFLVKELSHLVNLHLMTQGLTPDINSDPHSHLLSPSGIGRRTGRVEVRTLVD